jgi:hypothetical protein
MERIDFQPITEKHHIIQPPLIFPEILKAGILASAQNISRSPFLYLWEGIEYTARPFMSGLSMPYNFIEIGIGC